MSNTAHVDLRFSAEVIFDVDENVSYYPSIDGFLTLDTGYTLEINGLTKTVGSGLTLVPVDGTTGGNIVIEVLDTDFPVGSYDGCLTSDSKIAGVYAKIKVIIHSHESDC